MELSAYIADKHVWLLLFSGMMGTVMGINRTIKTKGNESRVLQLISAVMGILLIAVSIIFVLQKNDSLLMSGYTIQLMTIMGLCLSARQLEKVPATAALILVFVAAIVFAISHWGLPEILQRADFRKIAVLAGIAILGAIMLVFLTIEKSVDLVLAALGFGLVVIAISAIGLAHAIVILTSGDARGLMRYVL